MWVTRYLISDLGRNFVDTHVKLNLRKYSSFKINESSERYNVVINYTILIQWILSKVCALRINPLKYAHKNEETKGFFQFEIIINVLVSSFRFIWIPML